MAHRSKKSSAKAPAMTDFHSWIAELNLSSPQVLEQKVDQICRGVKDRLNPKDESEYIKVMQSHLFLEVWSQIKIFIAEQWEKGEYFEKVQLSKVNSYQTEERGSQYSNRGGKGRQRRYQGPKQTNTTYSASLWIQSKKDHIQIPFQSHLLLLWKDRKAPIDFNDNTLGIGIDPQSENNTKTETEGKCNTESDVRYIPESTGSTALHGTNNKQSNHHSNGKGNALNPLSEGQSEGASSTNHKSNNNSNSNPNKNENHCSNSNPSSNSTKTESAPTSKGGKNSNSKPSKKKKDPFPAHVVVQVSVVNVQHHRYKSTWDIQLALNSNSYSALCRHQKQNKNKQLIAIPIKNLIYLQRDYDATRNVRRMPLSAFIMGREYMMKQKKQSQDELFSFIKGHSLMKKVLPRRLNHSQMNAVKEALKRPLSLIHGPPGTGKTNYTLLPILKCAFLALQKKYDLMNRNEMANIAGNIRKGNQPPHYKLIRQIRSRWRVGRIGIFAGSNQAVDQILTSIFSLNNSGDKMCLDLPLSRIGNTFNINPEVADRGDVNVNHQVERYLAFKWDKRSRGDSRDYPYKLNRRMDNVKSQLTRISKDLLNVLANADRKRVLNDGKTWYRIQMLFESAMPLMLESECLDTVHRTKYPNQALRALIPKLMDNAQCIFSTANYLGRYLGQNRFDFALFDESCQLRETETLIALQHCDRATLIGDPKQLEATILYHGKYRNLLLNSLFDRVEKYINPLMLQEQYRMHPEIALFPSKHFYGGKLKNGDSIESGIRNRHFHDHPSELFKPYLFFDCVGAEEKNSTGSIVNHEEIECLQKVLQRFVDEEERENLKEIESIGIITPYLAHKNVLESKVVDPMRKYLKEHGVVVECNTVDEFQGSERDIIIFSCVRSNGQRNIGFLSDRRRINVAITRAKYALWIIGNASFLQEADPTWKALIDDVVERKLLEVEFR